jgi:putative phosphoribosyl transferase
MPPSRRLWRDRRDAGQSLARRFLDCRHAGASTSLVALPRGGVPVAAAMADLLDLPLFTWAVRKLAQPWAPEVAIGAVAPGNVALWADPPYGPGGENADGRLDDLMQAERQELARRQSLFGDPDPILLAGRHLIVVDDGIATGMTTRAALISLRRWSPASLSLGVPVLDRRLLPLLQPLVERLEVLQVADHLRSVGEWYEQFEQLDDDQVLALLQRVRRGAAADDQPLWAQRSSDLR